MTKAFMVTMKALLFKENVMDRPLTVLVTAVLVATAFSGSAFSAPFHPLQKPHAGQGLAQNIDGCHRGYRYHYVPEIRDEAEHKHRGSYCVPVILENGGGYDDGDDYYHCHRNGQRHSHPGYGRTTHSHYGSRCRIDVWNQWQGTGACRNKLKIGPLTFCNN